MQIHLSMQINITVCTLATPGFKVECDSDCRRILELRMNEGLLCQGPVFQDVLTVANEGEDLLRVCDGLMGGFPCQDACQEMSMFMCWLVIQSE